MDRLSRLALWRSPPVADKPVLSDLERAEAAARKPVGPRGESRLVPQWGDDTSPLMRVVALREHMKGLEPGSVELRDAWREHNMLLRVMALSVKPGSDMGRLIRSYVPGAFSFMA
jgi:hypothetical protein